MEMPTRIILEGTFERKRGRLDNSIYFPGAYPSPLSLQYSAIAILEICPISEGGCDVGARISVI